jgi:hypothetical protein
MYISKLANVVIENFMFSPAIFSWRGCMRVLSAFQLHEYFDLSDRQIELLLGKVLKWGINIWTFHQKSSYRRSTFIRES